ncbi:sterol desaturase family protein [Mastigocoleus testarum]|uniref:Sterol desaturase n=1 Tax=Mastigocoleus testarum BC008 TaxID=371196 RepID=A0A0V7ZSU1_9CYAN|nr:sterol desaturase family protein [Mastigocoleus testarum]KST67415.1 sterol desaturase [Mastigocoleus testarum BC008]
MLVFFTFFTLLALIVIRDRQLNFLQKKSSEDWILDTLGLFFQGIVIPLLQLGIIYRLYQNILPNLHNCYSLHPILGFILSFVIVDYFYYWNHRLFHTSLMWRIHQVHHTVTQMDVLGTSRNTLWTSFLIIYLWIHPLFIYLIQDPSYYILGVSLTSALDLWRHSCFNIPQTSFFYRCLSPWLILPQDHALHHASSCIKGNYGANFKLWDRVHGTYFESNLESKIESEKIPESLGVKTNLTLIQKLFLPI